MDVELHQLNDHLYILRERLDLLEPRFLTKYVNLYLVLGTHTAALIDTGHGMSGLRKKIMDLIEDRELLVFNTHYHFDHVAGNYEFRNIHIHKLDYKGIAFPLDLGFLEDAGTEYSKEFEVLGYKMPVCNEVFPLIGGEVYDLGGLKIEIIHTPGHTGGSICIATTKGELFTGDTIHYGAVYLPEPSIVEFYKETLRELAETYPSYRIYPGHEEFEIGIEVVWDLLEALESLEKSETEYNEYLDANLYRIGRFTLVSPT